MSRLIRSTYKSVAYGLRYHTINQRLKKSAQKFDAQYDELSKVTAEIKKLTCPKKIEEAMRVLEMGNESGSVLRKLVDDYKHFKIHEEPGLIASNMFRDYVLPSTAAITLVTLIGEIAYSKKLKEHCQVIETQLSDVAVLECELSNMEALEEFQRELSDKSAQ